MYWREAAVENLKKKTEKCVLNACELHINFFLFCAFLMLFFELTEKYFLSYNHINKVWETIGKRIIKH
jgi:hypothetical protein